MNDLENKALEPTNEPIPAAEEQLQAAEPQQEPEAIAGEETEVTKEATMPDYHTYDKGQLTAALVAIVSQRRVDAHKEVGIIKQSFYSIRSKELEKELAAFIDAGNEPTAFAAMPDEEETKFKEALQEFRTIRNEYLEAEEKRRAENLAKKNEIIEKLRAIVEDIDNVNLRYNEFSQLQQEFKAIKDVPASEENNIWKTYQGVVEQFYDHLKMNKELRDLAFKKNLEAKRALIEEAKALMEAPDVIDSARRLQDIHVRWKDVGPVAKDLRDSIWEEFRAVSAVVNKRHQEYFSARKETESANEEAKRALLEEIKGVDTDKLTRFKDWEEATAKVQELQKKWREIGFAARKVNSQLFTEFRALCDKFFEEKGNFYKSIKEQHASNLEKKEALIARVEALKETTPDIHKCIQEVLKIREEWKTIGSVARRNSDDVWERFRNACDYYFSERRQQKSSVKKEENANLAAKKEVIEKIKQIDRTLERPQLLAAIRELQSEWQAIGHVPFKVKDQINGEYRALCDEIYESLGSAEKNRRMSNFENQLNSIKGDNNKVDRERERLYRSLDAKKAELKTVENNLGFFNVKSSAGNSMVKEIERRAERIRADIEEIQGKIKMLNSATDE